MSESDNPTAFGSATFGSGRLGFADDKDVDQFVHTLERFERGEMTGDEWRAFRLVNGVYGQRQDDVHMIRVKAPQGLLTPAQLRALADVAERWSNGKGHVTTRQNIQFHFVTVADAPKALDHLAKVDLTTREACGNAVRNITGCPFAGTRPEEPFDVTPYAQAITRHLLRGPYSSKLPRKFKNAVGGCCGNDDVEASINDVGLLSRVDAEGRRGFRMTAGGGTSTLRRTGVLVHEFLPVEECVEACEAVVRVFDKFGNRKDKHKARLKFAIGKLGLAGFLAEYEKERAAIRAEGGRPLVLPEVLPAPKLFAEPTGPLPEARPDFDLFAKHNVKRQRQEGFSSVIVRLPLGDITTEQFRKLADLVVAYADGELRTTHDQNLVLRFVPTWQVPALHRELVAMGLGRAGANTVADTVSCPGASSCKLAVTASRGLGELLANHFDARPELNALAPGLDIKISGCPNGCGQHHISALGFQGGVRKVGGRAVPQYHLFMGGQMGANEALFGKMVAKIPARRIPQAVERLIKLYVETKREGETPGVFFQRTEAAVVQKLLKDLGELDETNVTPEDFIDLGEDKAFEVVLGEGECAA